ncbi:MAG: decaprenyl-phosphate phosphoribosyltransferase [Proteobacteria bacterium]|nr:decaprenyl-phosphate phosphoribosyltransferase [Pseudomonadota bacterium]
MSPYFRILRPHQWIKNGFVLAPLIFSERLLDPRSFSLAFATFVVFCFLSSSTYVFNDLFDRQADRAHPLKKHRPLPAGEITPRAAALLGGAFALAGIAGAVFLGKMVLLTGAGYLALQTAYNLFLRQLVILDILAIAMGFVIRALAGSVAIGVTLSPWLILCTLLVALFLGFAKRRHEIVLMGTEASSHRRILSEYSLPFLDQLIGIVTAATIVSYAIYTLSPEVTRRLGSSSMILTLPFVIYGIFRYLYLVHLREGGGSPARDLLADRALLICIFLWGVVSVALIYA